MVAELQPRTTRIPSESVAHRDGGSEASRVVVPSIRCLRLKAVCEMTSLSKAGVYRAMRLERFPAPVKLGIGTARNRTSAWIESEVQAWLFGKIRTCRRTS
ncbi:MAG: helix-turn-helix transcriptional regulator [Burkholderiales bacterium]